MQIFSGKSLWAEKQKDLTAQDRLSNVLHVGVATAEQNKNVGLTSSMDRVSISEEARKKQQEVAEESARVNNLAQEQAPNDKEQVAAQSIDGSSLSTNKVADPATSDDASIKEFLRKQIREIAKQLAEAQARLAAAQGQSRTNELTNSVGKSATPEAAEEAENPEAVASENEAPATERQSEENIKRLEGEVEQLTSALAVLNLELLKHEKKAGAKNEPALGTAGINETGTGEAGGLGERMVIGGGNIPA